jgi:hypothetical protein
MLFKKIKQNKMDQPLAKSTKRRKKTRMNKIRGEKGNRTTDTNEIQVIIQKCIKNL